MSQHTADRVLKVAKRANSNSQRWRNQTYTKAVDSMAQLAPEDPAMKKPFVTAATEWLHDLPFMPVTFSRKLYGFDTTYWTGWATSEDDYLQPTLDWADAHKIIHRLKRA
jgi:peptide/nickel transport system substrate-binding protein